MTRICICCCAILAAACLLDIERAEGQIIWGGEAERGFRPGTSIPHDGMPFSHRYGYSTNDSYLYLPFSNQDGRTLHYLDYADRVERAYKFGYKVPAAPYEPPCHHCRPRVGLGLGLGYFRFR